MAASTDTWYTSRPQVVPREPIVESVATAADDSTERVAVPVNRSLMYAERAITLVLVISSLFVVGSLAGSVDSTISSSPDDAIDLNYDSIPLSRDQGTALKQAFQGGTGSSSNQNAAQGSGSETQPTGSAASPPADRSGQHNGGTQQRSSATGRQDGAAGQQATGGQGAGSGDSNDGQGQGAGSSGHDGLFALLGRLLEWLAVLIGLGILVAGAALGVRRREHLGALFRRGLDRLGVLGVLERVRRFRTDPAAAVDADPVAAPANAIERAWHQMLERTGVEADQSATPRQCASAVVSHGGDGEAVQELTDLFERVRYGDEADTPEHARRALRCLRRAVDGAGGEA